MKRTAAVLSVAAVALWSAEVFAQGRNFAGSWTIDSERTAAANVGAAGGGVMRSGGGGGGRGGAVGAGTAGTGAAEMRVAAGGAVAGGGGGRGGGMAAGPTTIALDATTFTVGATAYKLDGSVTTIETPRGNTTAKAAWKADKLVIESTNQGPNGPVVTTATRYLDGESLVRENSTPGPDGGAAIVRKTYYKKG